MELKDRVELFSDELNLIKDNIIREFVIACIDAAPDYVFYDCPASSSGKYHPIGELGGDGTILHTKKVVLLAKEFCNALQCTKYMDEIIAAAILHDLAKQGIEKYGHTVKDHPQIMANIIADVYKNSFNDNLSRERVLMIYFCVFYHYGPWTIPEKSKSITKYTLPELAVFLADYIASRRFISINKEG